MKVIILTSEPFPNGMAATNRIKCYARALTEGGINCEVVIFRRTEVYGRPPKNTIGTGTSSGIPYRYIGKTPLRDSNVFIRQLNDIRDIINTADYLRKNLTENDVLFLYMGKDLGLTLKFIKIAHKKGAFCVRDLCELPYGTGTEDKNKSLLRKKVLEKQIPEFDGIISISDTLSDLAKKYAQPGCKHIKVPIMVDFDKYDIPDDSEKAEVPYIFHSGTLYQQKDGILGMIEAFGKARRKIRENIAFVSTGTLDTSPHKNEISDLIRKYHLEGNISFTGYLSCKELQDYMSKASLVIINKYCNQQNRYCFSTKLGEYLAASKPVVITNVGEAVNWLENKKSAYIVEPEDTDALADAIVQVFTHQEESRMVGIAGKEVCHKCFDYRNWSRPLAEFMNQLGK